MSTSADLFGVAVEHFEQGRISEAEATCHEVIRNQPQHLSALQLAGLLALGTRRAQLAVDYLGRALALAEHPASLVNLGEAYRRLGRSTDAAAALSRALELAPDLAEGYFNYGVIHHEQGDHARACACFEHAIRLSPDVAIFHRGLGSSLLASGELSLAEAHLRTALDLSPSLASAHFELARLLDGRAEPEQALLHYTEGLRFDPDNATALCNAATTLMKLERFDEAVASIHRSLELDAGSAEAHANLGNALRLTGRVAEAIPHYRRALELDPQNAAVHSTLVFSLSFHPELDDDVILDEARRFEQQHAKPLAAESSPVTERRTRSKLRIGYVSADFRYHVESLFMLPLLEAHDRSQFEIYLYSNVKTPDAITERHRDLATELRNIARLDDAAAAKLVRSDKIDILVDLSMHTGNNRLPVFARRPAPLQVSWLAYSGTTGLSSIDYRLTDPYIDPPTLDPAAAERSWHLPDTVWCFRPHYFSPDEHLEPGPLPALRNGFITFGSLNQFSKVNERALALWAKAILAVERSRLLLHAPPGESRERVATFLEHAGVARDRVDFVGFQARQQYLATYRQIDVALDTLPFAGHTTSLETWWMGVPVLSLRGSTISGRGGASLTRNLGLPEWCVNAAADYADAAHDLTRDVDALSILRASLRSRIERSPLMDSTRFARNIEAAYRGMWQEHTSERQVAPIVQQGANG